MRDRLSDSSFEKLEVNELLDVAIKYKEQLEKLQYNIWFKDKYKFWNNDTYYDAMTIDDSTWERHQFVSIKDDNVIGYISYSVNRRCNYAHSLSIMNFTDDKMTFGMDLGQVLQDIFEKYNFRKLDFCVVVGNPIEKSYDKIVKKYNGRIVGTFKDDVKLIDNKYYDIKHYEVTKENYMGAKNK